MIPKLIKWAAGPIGKWVLLALLVAAWTLFNRVDAAHKARADCQLDHVEAALAEQQDRAERAEKIATEARNRADTAEAELAELETARNELLSEFDDQDGSCALPDDLRDRLLGIQ